MTDRTVHTESPTPEREAWDRVREIIGADAITLGPSGSRQLRNNPAGIVAELVRYKFAAKMIGQNRRIIELSCGEGLGTPILAEHAHRYVGVDTDHDAIQIAQAQWANDRVSFTCADGVSQRQGAFDAAVCLHVEDSIESLFDALAEHVTQDGVVVAGVRGDQDYAPMQGAAARRFHHVMAFGMSGDTLRAGWDAPADYYLIVACHRRAKARCESQHKPPAHRHPSASNAPTNSTPVVLGPMHAYHARNTPRRLLYTLSYYRFAAAMIGRETSVLDVGCGEGLGTSLLAQACGSAHGIDFDESLINVAKHNWRDEERITFACQDMLDAEVGAYDAAVTLDVIEHVMPDHADGFVAGLAARLKPYGMAVVGTPNETSAIYASKATNAGHVNLYSGDQLRQHMERYFTQVFMFGANDEVIHTGFLPMAHYLIAVACKPRINPD